MDSLLDEVDSLAAPDLSVPPDMLVVPDLSSETPDWCTNCQSLRQEIKKLQDEQVQSFGKLKQKIISTDLLIKKYKSKCEDYDVQCKKTEEATKRWEKFQRQSEILEAQLKAALLDTEPLRSRVASLEAELATKSSTFQTLSDTLDALQSSTKQYEHMNKASVADVERLECEKRDLKAKLKDMESSRINTESAKQYRSEISMLKKEKAVLAKNEQRLEKRLVAALNKMEQMKNNIKKHEGHSPVRRRSSGFHSPTKSPQGHHSLLKSPRGHSPLKSPLGHSPLKCPRGRSPRGRGRVRTASERSSSSSQTREQASDVFGLDSPPGLTKQSPPSPPTGVKVTADKESSSSWDGDSDDDTASMCSVAWTFSPVVKCLSPLPPSPACFSAKQEPVAGVSTMDSEEEGGLSDMADVLEMELLATQDVPSAQPTHIKTVEVDKKKNTDTDGGTETLTALSDKESSFPKESPADEKILESQRSGITTRNSENNKNAVQNHSEKLSIEAHGLEPEGNTAVKNTEVAKKVENISNSDIMKEVPKSDSTAGVEVKNGEKTDVNDSGKCSESSSLFMSPSKTVRRIAHVKRDTLSSVAGTIAMKETKETDRSRGNDIVGAGDTMNVTRRSSRNSVENVKTALGKESANPVKEKNKATVVTPPQVRRSARIKSLTESESSGAEDLDSKCRQNNDLDGKDMESNDLDRRVKRNSHLESKVRQKDELDCNPGLNNDLDRRTRQNCKRRLSEDKRKLSDHDTIDIGDTGVNRMNDSIDDVNENEVESKTSDLDRKEKKTNTGKTQIITEGNEHIESDNQIGSNIEECNKTTKTSQDVISSDKQHVGRNDTEEFVPSIQEDLELHSETEDCNSKYVVGDKNMVGNNQESQGNSKSDLSSKSETEDSIESGVDMKHRIEDCTENVESAKGQTLKQELEVIKESENEIVKPRLQSPPSRSCLQRQMAVQKSDSSNKLLEDLDNMKQKRTVGGDIKGVDISVDKRSKGEEPARKDKYKTGAGQQLGSAVETCSRNENSKFMTDDKAIKSNSKTSANKTNDLITANGEIDFDCEYQVLSRDSNVVADELKHTAQADNKRMKKTRRKLRGKCKYVDLDNEPDNEIFNFHVKATETSPKKATKCINQRNISEESQKPSEITTSLSLMDAVHVDNKLDCAPKKTTAVDKNKVKSENENYDQTENAVIENDGKVVEDTLTNIDNDCDDDENANDSDKVHKTSRQLSTGFTVNSGKVERSHSTESSHSLRNSPRHSPLRLNFDTGICDTIIEDESEMNAAKTMNHLTSKDFSKSGQTGVVDNENIDNDQRTNIIFGVEDLLLNNADDEIQGENVNEGARNVNTHSGTNTSHTLRNNTDTKTDGPSEVGTGAKRNKSANEHCENRATFVEEDVKPGCSFHYNDDHHSLFKSYKKDVPRLSETHDPTKQSVLVDEPPTGDARSLTASLDTFDSNSESMSLTESRASSPSFGSYDRTSPVSPLSISPFCFMNPISPLPPSPVKELERVSPLSPEHFVQDAEELNSAENAEQLSNEEMGNLANQDNVDNIHNENDNNLNQDSAEVEAIPAEVSKEQAELYAPKRSETSGNCDEMRNKDCSNVAHNIQHNPLVEGEPDKAENVPLMQQGSSEVKGENLESNLTAPVTPKSGVKLIDTMKFSPAPPMISPVKTPKRKSTTKIVETKGKVWDLNKHFIRKSVTKSGSGTESAVNVTGVCKSDESDVARLPNSCKGTEPVKFVSEVPKTAVKVIPKAVVPKIAAQNSGNETSVGIAKNGRNKDCVKDNASAQSLTADSRQDGVEVNSGNRDKEHCKSSHTDNADSRTHIEKDETSATNYTEDIQVKTKVKSVKDSYSETKPSDGSKTMKRKSCDAIIDENKKAAKNSNSSETNVGEGNVPTIRLEDSKSTRRKKDKTKVNNHMGQGDGNANVKTGSSIKAKSEPCKTESCIEPTMEESSTEQAEEMVIGQDNWAFKRRARLAHRPNIQPLKPGTKIQLIDDVVLPPPSCLSRKRKNLNNNNNTRGSQEKKQRKETTAFTYQAQKSGRTKVQKEEAKRMQAFMKSTDTAECFVRRVASEVGRDSVAGVLLTSCIDCLCRVRTDSLDIVHRVCMGDELMKLGPEFPFLNDAERKALELLHHIAVTTELKVEFSSVLGQLCSCLFDVDITCSIVGKMSLCRVYTALCALKGDVETVRILFHRIMKCGHLNSWQFLVPIVSIWPETLHGDSSDRPDSVQSHSMVLVLEEILTKQLLSLDTDSSNKIIQVMQKLCHWNGRHGNGDVIVKTLLSRLSQITSADSPDKSCIFDLNVAMEMLVLHEGWAWCKEQLIVKHGLQTAVNKYMASNISVPVTPEYMAAVLKMTSMLVNMHWSSIASKDYMMIVRKWLLPILSRQSGAESVRDSCLETLIEMTPFQPTILVNIHQWFEDNRTALSDHTITRLEQLRCSYKMKYALNCKPFSR